MKRYYFLVLVQTGCPFMVNLTKRLLTMENVFKVDNCGRSVKSLMTRTSRNGNYFYPSPLPMEDKKDNR